MFPVYTCVSSLEGRDLCRIKSPSMLFQEGIVEVSLISLPNYQKLLNLNVC